MEIDYSIVLPFVRDDRRPYLDAHVEAHHEGKLIGYVKFEWVSSLRFDELLPTVWHYAGELSGWCLGLEPDSDMSDPEVIYELWKRVRNYSHWRPYDSHPDISAEEMMIDLEKMGKRKGLYRKFEDFKTSMDYVYVGYSKVEDGDRWPKEHGVNYQRQGIGLTLYKLAAMWLAINMETSLHSSTLIKPCAMGVWQKMIDLGYPVTTCRRPETNKYVNSLDYTSTPLLLETARKTLGKLPHRDHDKYPTFVV